jgi:hypothetical protein
MRRKTDMSIIREFVDRQFADAERSHPRGLENPVTGEYWLANVVPTEPEKRNACRATLAREWFELNGPPDAPPLPISDTEIYRYVNSGDFACAVARYAESLRDNDWDIRGHPTFEEFVGGLLCLPQPQFAEPRIIARRFYPKPLPGLWPTGIWKPIH